MDPLLPVLEILDTSVPVERQQCMLRASKEAKAAQGKSLSVNKLLREPKTAYREAKKRCHIDNPTEAQYLGQLVLTFGWYFGRSFKWLVENDVGYIKYVLDRHLEETQDPKRKTPINDGWLKDSLMSYVTLFPPVSCHLEVNVDRAIYGQGQFKSFTFLEMWSWYSLHTRHQADPQAGSEQERKKARDAHAAVKQWLLKKEGDITTKSLKRFRAYILEKEKSQSGAARPAATPSAAAATPSAPPTATPSAAAAAPSCASWCDDDDIMLDALVTFESSQGKPADELSTSQPQPAPPAAALPPAAAPPASPGPPLLAESGQRAKKSAKKSQKRQPAPPAAAAPPASPEPPLLTEKRAKKSQKQQQPAPPAAAAPPTPERPLLAASEKRAKKSAKSQTQKTTPASKSAKSQTQPPPSPSQPAPKPSSRSAKRQTQQPAPSTEQPAPKRPSRSAKSQTRPPPSPSQPAPKRPSRTSKRQTQQPAPSSPSQPEAQQPETSTSQVAPDARPEPQPSPSPSNSQSQPASAATLSQSDSPVELEGWVRLWEDPSGIPAADVTWLKEDSERGLFTSVQTFKDVRGQIKRRRVLKSDRMWFYPPEPPGYLGSGVPSPQPFFRSRLFFWRPVGVWRCSISCPRGDACAGAGRNTHLSKSGYHIRVRHICDVSGWYSMCCEVLCCGPCLKAARGGDGGPMGRWLAWDDAILHQLSEAHQAMFPAVLTAKRGVDKSVLNLLRDRTEGNTMAKVWRQVRENHMEEHNRRRDLYTTLLMALVRPGSIVSALGHGEFRPPPPPRELPCERLLRHAFLLAEANNVQDYRSQILSTFGTVLKMDSTKKVVKKLSGEGKGSAEWFTSIGNELSQIVSFVLTCEESVEKLEPMCRGVMERFRLANQPVPQILYIDRGCCRAQGPTAVETLFQPWVDNGMVVRLDIFHWLHRFDAALRTEAHSKYPALKSALAGAVLAYNRQDLDLLIAAVRARVSSVMEAVSDEDVVRRYISREQLKHHVRRVTLGGHETFRLIHLIIEELKGPAGLDESGVSLFKSTAAINEMWASQQRHLECIQDPPGMSMYRVARTTTINGVDVPYYKCLRGSNSLEGFHRSLPHMIPGPHCAARPYQVYLVSGIARWNADRSSAAVFGGRQRSSIYSAPLVDRLNARCQLLFGEAVDQNFRPPANVQSDELLGLEYLFRQSTGESEAFSLDGLVDDGPAPEEEVYRPGEDDPGAEADEAYQSDEDLEDIDAARITLTNNETATVHPPAFEDACSANPLPGFQELEAFCATLVQLGGADQKLQLTTDQRNAILDAWNAVEEHDKQPQKYHQLYRTHWGNTLYCRTKRDDLGEAALIQRVKMARRYAPAQQDISAQHNRLMYVLVKLLWLSAPQSSRTGPEKASILKAYELIQHRVLVDDPVLSKAGIPLPKINVKTVRDFIRQQERLVNFHATRQPSVISKTTSVSSTELPPAPRQPDVLPPPDYPVMEYVPTASTAGTKKLRGRADMAAPSQLPPPQPLLPPPQPLPLVRPLQRPPATFSITEPVPTPAQSVAGPSSTQTAPTAAPLARLVPILPAPALAGPSSSQTHAAPASWSRSTHYKRKLVADQPTQVGAKLFRVQHIPNCKVCGQPIQGHKKYKKKTYCPVKDMSPSKGLDNRVYRNFAHFVAVIDGLED
ncbi:uncharacterized protein LOC121704885 [Alosa sapidissima]|uniref:uncharacterized protein LOC121704885 n=1 Tax=Alosa sapidissima TaxID=34773 RepID=UPI001C0923CD|nr:uncharacterized protein LOC121704885 [Alosa sapidissima]